MKVSVLIISYKRAKYLRNAIGSLSKQTIKPDEVIVVLKPSNDGSEEVIKEFSDRLSIKLLIQEGVGPIDAYTKGIKNASGEILLFLDDDAIAEPDWVKKYIQLFNENPNVGGITGLALKAELVNDSVILKDELFYEDSYKESHAIGIHRYRLEILN
ncbi:MAG: glycosyltransferase family 2 protein, partial [Nitrososphaeria archaeon]|nr:glycosyltransferase family 2 protein [Nitrososphaeria archaeon]